MQIKNAEIFIPKKEYPKFDNFVVIYVGVVLFFQTLLQISPVVTALAATPLYSIQTYLGLLGGGLIVADVFTTKRVWQGKYVLFLLAILVAAVLATDRMVPYGLKENLFKLCWMAIQFCLVYSCVHRIPRAELEDRIKTLFYGLLTVWIFACCISLVQYVQKTAYQEVVNPLAQDTSANWQGYHDGRLYGIFYTLNHAAYVSLFFAILAVVCALGEKRIWTKLALSAAVVILLTYIILSGSTSAQVSLLTCLALAAWLAIRSKRKTEKPVDRQKTAIVCIVILLVIALGCTGLVAMNPGILEAIGDEELLDKTDVEALSNGRLKIWADYISLYKEIGPIGLSPGNYMPYILQNHPELFVVRAAKHFSPGKYNSGIIYHVHSGYMMVFVSTGILGLAALAAFIALCSKLLWRILQKKKTGLWFACGLLLVVAGAISAAFDEGLFFQNNPQTTMFWFALGFILSDRLTETAEQQRFSIEERCNENVG